MPISAFLQQAVSGGLYAFILNLGAGFTPSGAASLAIVEMFGGIAAYASIRSVTS